MKTIVLIFILSLVSSVHADDFCKEYGEDAIIVKGIVYGLQKQNSIDDCNFSLNSKMVFAEGEICQRIKNGQKVKYCLRKTEGSNLYDFLSEEVRLFD
jgi:hypothetical protein